MHDPSGADRTDSLTLVALVISATGMALLPWAEVSGQPQRGNGIAEHLLAVPSVAGERVSLAVRMLGMAWYVGVAGILGSAATIVFASGRRTILRASTFVGLAATLLLAFAVQAARLPQSGPGPAVASAGGLLAVILVWRGGGNGHRWVADATPPAEGDNGT